MSLSPWNQQLGGEKQRCGFLCLCLPLMKCTISSVPKLVTVLQVIKRGISFNPQWLNHACLLSCCNIRNAFPSDVGLLSHVQAFLRRPICPQIVKFEDVVNQDISQGYYEWLKCGLWKRMKKRSVIRKIFIFPSLDRTSEWMPRGKVVI